MARFSASTSFGLSPATSASSGVSEGPGHTTLLVVFDRAASRATVFEKPMRPDLHAE